jgi:hypothetical protein
MGIANLIAKFSGRKRSPTKQEKDSRLLLEDLIEQLLVHSYDLGQSDFLISRGWSCSGPYHNDCISPEGIRVSVLSSAMWMELGWGGIPLKYRKPLRGNGILPELSQRLLGVQRGEVECEAVVLRFIEPLDSDPSYGISKMRDCDVSYNSPTAQSYLDVAKERMTALKNGQRHRRILGTASYFSSQWYPIHAGLVALEKTVAYDMTKLGIPPRADRVGKEFTSEQNCMWRREHLAWQAKIVVELCPA